ncbi:MAG: N-terminal phage integrase SAM-like domain-containing protein [Ruminococcus sp.]
MVMPCLHLHMIMFVEVVNMTKNTQFKTLLNTWLNQKKPMITPSTHASFTLIAENHLIPYFGKRKIGSITGGGYSELYYLSP